MKDKETKLSLIENETVKKELGEHEIKVGERLLDAMGDIKDDFVIEAASEKPAFVEIAVEQDGVKKAASVATKGRRRWMRYLSVAAVLVLCVGVGSKVLLNNKGDVVHEVTEEYAPASAAPEGSASDLSFGESATAEKNESEPPVEGIAEAEEGDSDVIMEPIEGPTEVPTMQGEAFVLTAGQWNDNANWPFFTNLVNSGTISFPSFGIDPRNRIKATIVDGDGNPLAGEVVTLRTSGAGTLWKTKSNKDGVAYLFVPQGGNEAAAYVECNGEMAMLETEVIDYDSEDGNQGTPTILPQTDEITIVTEKTVEDASGVQVMFIVDTTGSMGDELSYLQMDFAQIARDTAEDGVTYSVNFYRDEGDEYVTKTNGFTSSAEEIIKTLNSEYSMGGGDTPEAVADILKETITDNGAWNDNANKVCFLIFDAPPHVGTEDRIIEAVKSAAERGIHMVPVVASNAERETELFGRALAICTDGEYVFLTDHSGVGLPHLEPIIGDYEVELLHDIIVRIINSYR